MGVFSDWLSSLFRPRRPVDPSGPPSAAPDPAEVVVFVNAARATRVLIPYLSHPALQASAQTHAEAERAAGVMAHRELGEPDMGARLTAAGYRFRAAGECVAAGQPTARAVVDAWLSDPPHRAILLGSFVHVGVGVAADRAGRPYWCLDAASPLPALPTTPPGTPAGAG